MIDYRKLCKMILRILGAGFCVYGVISILINILFLSALVLFSDGFNVGKVEFPWLVQIPFGLILFFMSEKLSNLICVNLDKNE